MLIDRVLVVLNALHTVEGSGFKIHKKYTRDPNGKTELDLLSNSLRHELLEGYEACIQNKYEKTLLRH